MAQCPQCADSTLVHAMLTESLAGYSCGNCLGTLVSLVAYRAWREHAGKHALRSAPPASKYRISADRDNRLDYCAHCEEIWLDDGEWQLIESLVASGELTKVFTQAWQRAVRADVTGTMEERRLRELLGADYDRFIEFARWLDAQPAKQEMLARLSRPK